MVCAFDEVLPDIEVKFRDGSTRISTSSTCPGQQHGRQAGNEQTLEDVLATINAVARQSCAEIAPGRRPVAADRSNRGRRARVQVDVGVQFEARSLIWGLMGASDGGVITGRRLIGGLGTTLLSTLDGGRGVGELGTVNLRDRSGAQATVNLAGGESWMTSSRGLTQRALASSQRQCGAERHSTQRHDRSHRGKLIVASGDDKGIG
jgi:flagellar hook-associated protein 2